MFFNFFHLFFSLLISSLSIIGSGFLLKKIANIKNDEDIAENAFLGIILISILVLITNFFFKISSNFSYLILFLPLIFCFKKLVKLKKEIFNFCLISSLISILIMIFDNSNRPDAGLYHLPFSQIINENKIIIGLSNIHFRFGHTSILQYLASGFNNELFSVNGISIPLSFFFSVSCVYFIQKIFKEKNIFYKLIFFLFFFNILYSMNRYSGQGNDDPATIFFYLSIISFFIFLTSGSGYKLLIIYSSFTFLIKPFYIFVLLFPLVAIYKKKIKIFCKINLFCGLVILIWLIRNSLISSCFFFPVNQSCISNLEWSMPKYVVNSVSVNSEAWAKSWPNYLDEGNKIAPEKFIKKNFWLSTWFKYHFKIVLNEISYQILLIFILFLLLRKNLDINRHYFDAISICLILNSIFVIIWFIKFPTFRYGHGYIVSFIIFLYLFSNYFINQKKYDGGLKFVNLLTVIVLTLIFFKHVKRIYTVDEYNYNYAPWPKIYSFQKNNKKNTNIAIYNNDNVFVYYRPYPYTLCMYSKAPCSVYPAEKNLSIKEKNGYTIYYLKK